MGKDNDARVRQSKKIIERPNKSDLMLLNKNVSKLDRWIRLDNLSKALDELSIDSNPFEWVVIDGDVSVAMKSGFSSLTPVGTMFEFNNEYNLEENTNTQSDPFFFREESGYITVIEP